MLTLKQRIKNMRAELAKMEAELEASEKIELEGGEWYIDGTGSVINIDTTSRISTRLPATRATKKLAEIASKNIVTRNKIEAYAHQLDPEWRDKGIGTMVFEISFNGKKYNVGAVHNLRFLGSVYMSKSTAEQICEWLNDGRIEL